MNEGYAVLERYQRSHTQWALAVIAGALMTACGGADTEDLAPEVTSTGLELADSGANLQPLLAAAQLFLEDRNQQLVDGSGTAMTPAAQQLSAAMSVRVTHDNAALRVLRDRLAQLGERYTGFETRTRLVEVQEVGGQLVARVEEITRFNYAKLRGDEPAFTASRVERRFVFSKREGEWLIEDVQLLDQGGLAPINEVVQAAAPTGEPPAAPLVRPSELIKGSLLLRDGGFLREAAERPYELSPYYNYSDMVTYATTWALDRNPAYRTFPNDCTNFISQAMSVGGWAMVSGWYQNNSAWWYNSLNQSYTWAGAQNWYWFATGSSRTYILSNVWSMALADVLQMDFDRDQNINHTMIVTYVSSSERYLSYHTTDTLNRSLSSIIAAYPSAWYYAHRT